MRRFFSPRQRRILAWASGGRCALCKTRLTRSFHADHKVPYCVGGRTITNNGQALCALCNVKKGSS